RRHSTPALEPTCPSCSRVRSRLDWPKSQADRNLLWSCDYCTRRRKDCDGVTPSERCRRLSLTCVHTLPARELLA
ncbi:unnamed protein product, partial [Ectocarpus sp. 13 AM-2016]